MDDERNAQLFRILREECSWRLELRRMMDECSACGKPCIQLNCEPLRFAIFFNRPEVRNG